MRYINLFVLFLLTVLFCGCQNTPTNQVSHEANTAPVVTDNRPKAEVFFLNRVKAESDYEVTSNAVKKDFHIAAFNKYAIDSLTKITDWEMIVTEVNDNQVESSSMAKALFSLGSNPIYNIIMVAPITIDRKVDTIAIDNRVDFTYTILKNPKSDMLKAQLLDIKTLSKGDTVILSGALTHLGDNLKVNFASFYDQSLPWNIDVLATKIKKKGTK